MLGGREQVVSINLALENDGDYQTFTGLFLLSTSISAQEVDGFLLALQRALQNVGLRVLTREQRRPTWEVLRRDGPGGKCRLTSIDC